MSLSSMNLPASWESPRLDEVADVIDSLHKTPKYSTDGYRMVRVTDVRGGFLDLSNAFFVTDEVFQEFSKRHKPQEGDIVFSRVGSYGNASYVKTDEPFCLGQNTAVIIPKINSRFLHQCLQSRVVKRQIEESAVGSTQKTISLKSINALRIPLPPESERDAIASILGALDDKIELNRRMNATLESLARAIFKSWFVDFDPVHANAIRQNAGKTGAGQMPASSAIPTTHDPKVLDLFPSTFQDSELGPIPEGWSAKPLSDVCDLLSGGTPKKKIEEYWNGNLPWISPKAMNGIHVFESDSCVTEAAVGNGTRLVPAGTTLVMVRGMGLHQGVRISQAQRDVTFNQDVKALVPTTVDSTFLLYAVLDAAPILFGKVRAAGHGTGVLSTDIIKSLEFPVPKDGLSELTQPLTELNQEIHSNELESQVLAELRDALLPQLLSGELPVPEALTATENALV